MSPEIFSLADLHDAIEKKFVDKGWIDIYKTSHNEIDVGMYCCLVKPNHLDEYMKTSNWGIEWGSEGRPSVITSFRGGKEQTEYFSFGEDGLEPFIYVKYFSHKSERYVDVSEEFVNYFKLYEKVVTKQDRDYYFIDDLGEMEHVIDISPERIRLKLKFLAEYLAVRKIHFSLCFDFMCLADIKGAGEAFVPKEVDYKSDTYNYNHLIRAVLGLGGKNLQSWIRGKVIMKYDPGKSSKFWYDLGMDDHEEFIIGYNDDGSDLMARSDSEEYKFFTPVFFKKEVLNKYYGNPEKYKVSGFHLQSKFISLKIDNNNDEYVTVFLNDLRVLPQKEQLHWKQYNIPRENGMGISGSYYDTMIEGNWARDSDAIDIRFKEKYERFNKRWNDKFGWYFYKPAVGADTHLFTSLHLPSENNIRSFCEQMLLIVKFTIDCLNEQKLVANLPKVENEKGISKLERFLKSHKTEIPDLISFLRHLQDLRSGMIAHRLSTSNKGVQRAIAFFNITDDNYRQVASEIFIKSLHTLNTFDTLFLTEDEQTNR